MPALYGQPRKDTLRKEIRELNSTLRSEQKQRREAQLRLEYAQLKIKELEVAVTRMGQKARELVSDATQDFDSIVSKKRWSARKKLFSRFAANSR